MSTTRTPTCLRTLLRATRRPHRLSTTSSLTRPALITAQPQPLSHQPRAFTSAAARFIDILPDADKPPHDVKESEPHDGATQATPLSDAEYQEKSDAFFEQLLDRLEAKQEEEGNLDVEYSVRAYSPSRCLMPRPALR